MTRLQRAATVAGLVLVVVGVGLFSFPAGVVVAGAALLVAGLTDFEG